MLLAILLMELYPTTNGVLYFDMLFY